MNTKTEFGLVDEIKDTFRIREVCRTLTDGSHVWNVTIGDEEIPCGSQRQAEDCANAISEAITKATR